MITDVSVILDARALDAGVWNFASMLKRLGPIGLDEGRFLKSWLSGWDQNDHINGYEQKTRKSAALTQLWSDFVHTPLRLSAIVFRPDLRTIDKPLGEVRFVYQVYDDVRQVFFDFTVILEFAPHFCGPTSLGEWAKAIHELGSLPFGKIFNERLQDVLERAVCRVDDTHTSLAQVRTNDFFLELEWELREFRPDSSGLWKQAPTADTPNQSYEHQDMAILATWLQGNASAVLSGIFKLPNRFWGGGAITETEDFAWLKGSSVPENVRQAFSVTTCNGCHGGDTETRFGHIFFQTQNTSPYVSTYLRSDLKRRAADLESILSGSARASEYRRVH